MTIPPLSHLFGLRSSRAKREPMQPVRDWLIIFSCMVLGGAVIVSFHAYILLASLSGGLLAPASQGDLSAISIDRARLQSVIEGYRAKESRLEALTGEPIPEPIA